jgi:hypothetical protein
MSFNVDNFTAIISDKGLASSNKFEVAIHFPNGSREQALELMCDTVSIAGKSIQDTPDIQYGVKRAIAYSVPQFNPLSLSFYCTEKLEEKKKLDEWQNLIIHTDDINSSNGGNFNVGYYDDYTSSSKIIVTKLSVSGEPVFKYEYREVYPKNVSSIDLSHGVSSGPLKITAEFNYAYSKDMSAQSSL